MSFLLAMAPAVIERENMMTLLKTDADEPVMMEKIHNMGRIVVRLIAGSHL